MLRNSGLVTALHALAMRAPIAIEIEDQGIGRCSPPVEAAVYFCAVEAIQNATKHAGEHVRVSVTLRRDAGTVHFAVTDDGIGMDPPTKLAGDGLTGMRDRIGAVGGTLNIVSSPGHGTTVSGTVPVDEPGLGDLATRSAHPA